jgi:hypothetical protein
MPDFHMVSFGRRDTAGARVDNGRPFGVEVVVEDWNDVGGPCPITLSIAPADCALSATQQPLLVPALGLGKARFQLTVLGPAGTLTLITAALPNGRTRTLMLMLRGRGHV